MENCQCCVDCCMGCGYFSFSAQPDTESSEISGHVSYRIVKMWNQVFGLKHSGPELEQMAQKIEYPVRKAAHMSEYAVLALLIFQALTAFDRKRTVDVCHLA